MYGPMTLKTCNGCSFLVRNNDNTYNCKNPEIHLGSNMDSIITEGKSTLVICPTICSWYNG